MGIHGRSRKEQIAFVEKWGISKYAQPVGGCYFLIDESYSRKLNDLFKYIDRGNFSREEVLFLNTGRHLRISSNAKIVARYGKGKNEKSIDVFLKRNDESIKVLSVTPFDINDPVVKNMIIS